jgi:hypothetical protein
MVADDVTLYFQQENTSGCVKYKSFFKYKLILSAIFVALLLKIKMIITTMVHEASNHKCYALLSLINLYQTY